MINCQFENGNKASLRHICVSVIIIKDGKVLLGQRGTFKGEPILESGKWGLIGGFFDRDETLIEAVKRESMEETGWEVENIEMLRINDNPNRPAEDRQNMEIVFMADALKKTGGFDEEVTNLEWFDLNNLPDQIAFDHRDNLYLYKKYLKEKFPLPILGASS